MNASKNKNLFLIQNLQVVSYVTAVYFTVSYYIIDTMYPYNTKPDRYTAPPLLSREDRTCNFLIGIQSALRILLTKIQVPCHSN